MRRAFLVLALLGAAAAADEAPYAPGPCPAFVARIRSWLAALPAAAPREREVIVARLVRAGEAAWPLLAEALGAPEYETQTGAVRALGRGRWPEAVPLLAKVAADRRRVLDVRILALAAIGERGEAAGVEWLLSFARGPEPELQDPAFRALGKIREPEAVEALLQIARASPGKLRGTAFEALVELTGRFRSSESLESWERWWRIEKYQDFFEKRE
ncbi:MAG: HEAT repeat domain-containing protein [Planctomycetes bacterium]|nr:HEAT repeat domain-containing protein [Planctomycetota bacterium]